MNSPACPGPELSLKDHANDVCAKEQVYRRTNEPSWVQDSSRFGVDGRTVKVKGQVMESSRSTEHSDEKTNVACFLLETARCSRFRVWRGKDTSKSAEYEMERITTENEEVLSEDLLPSDTVPVMEGFSVPWCDDQWSPTLVLDRPLLCGAWCESNERADQLDQVETCNEERKWMTR